MTCRRPFRSFACLLMLLACAPFVGWLSSAAHAGGELSEAHGNECLEGRLDRSRLLNFLAAEAEAQMEELRYDEATGRDTRNYPPDRWVDYLRMDLEIDIPDMNTPRFTAKQKYQFEVLGSPVKTLTLNAVQLDIQAVRLVRTQAGMERESYSYDGEHLRISFDPPLVPGRAYGLEIDYAAHDPVDGLFWLTEAEEWPDRPAQIHTQGQPETNRFWFPSHDFPNERLVTNIEVTAPGGYVVSTNGELSREPFAPQGRADALTWDYRLDGDHPVYLVTLIVGKFDIVDVAPEGARVRLPVYVPPGTGHLAELTYGNTHRMLEVFERRYGMAYPWGNRYAQLVVWNFGAGGMENTGATTMYDTAILDEIAMADRDLDSLIAHELAHQWFGDLVTCNSWEHIWLNEGWATYSQALWFEARDGYQDGYLNELMGAMRDLPRRDQMPAGSTHFRPAMASKVYHHPWEVFRRVSNPYPKGAAVLHMLRSMLGERVFFEATAEYLERFKHRTARTDDFRNVLQEVSGRSLEQFFDQWVYRPGTPNMDVRVQWDAARKELLIVAEQRQRIDAEHPAFVFDLPIEIHFGDGSDGGVAIVMPISEKRHERRVPLASEPAQVIIDPVLSVAMALTVNDSAERLINQARGRRSLAARVQAIRALETHAGERTESALAEIVARGGEREAMEAAGVLGRFGGVARLVEALRAAPERPKVRRAVVAALGEAIENHPDMGDAEAVLMRHASEQEPSYATRAAAIEALAVIADASHLPIIESALASQSQHDQVRNAALRSLSRMDLEAGIELAAPYAGFGHLSRTRPVAIDTIARLAHHNRERAFELVAPLLNDSERRTVRSAVEAMIHIAHLDANEALERLATRIRDPFLRDHIERTRPRVAAAIAGESDARALREEVQRLRREVDALRSIEESRGTGD